MDELNQTHEDALNLVQRDAQSEFYFQQSVLSPSLIECKYPLRIPFYFFDRPDELTALREALLIQKQEVERLTTEHEAALNQKVEKISIDKKKEAERMREG